MLRPYRALANPLALGAVAVSVVLQLVAATYDPLVDLLQLAELELADWLLVASAAAVPAVVGQTIKMATAARYRIETQSSRPIR